MTNLPPKMHKLVEAMLLAIVHPVREAEYNPSIDELFKALESEKAPFPALNS